MPHPQRPIRRIQRPRASALGNPTDARQRHQVPLGMQMAHILQTLPALNEQPHKHIEKPAGATAPAAALCRKHPLAQLAQTNLANELTERRQSGSGGVLRVGAVQSSSALLRILVTFHPMGETGSSSSLLCR